MVNIGELSNGIRIVCEEIPHVHSLALGIWIKTGSRYEKNHEHGVSHFLEHLMFKGTAHRSARQIAEELEAVGGILNAFTAKEYTCYYARVLSEHLDLAIDLLSDMVLHSLFDAGELEKERKVVLEEIKMYDDSPDELVHDLFAQTIWPDHPLGRAILGTVKSIQGMNRDHVLYYFQNRYIPENMVISAAGNINYQKLIHKLERVFGKLQSGSEDVEYKKLGSSTPLPQFTTLATRKDTEQVQLCLGTLGLALEDERLPVLQVLNNILGGGISSRLFQTVREEQALAYSVFSYYSSYRGVGSFTIYAGTSPDNSEKLLKLVLHEMAKLRDDGITEKELSRAKEQLKGNLLLSMESVNHRMSRLGKSLISHDRIITPEELIAKIQAVNVGQVQELAQLLFSGNQLALAVIGPDSGMVDLNQIVNSVKF